MMVDLPEPVCPEQGDDLAGLDVEVDPLEHCVRVPGRRQRRRFRSAPGPGAGGSGRAPGASCTSGTASRISKMRSADEAGNGDGRDDHSQAGAPGSNSWPR